MDGITIMAKQCVNEILHLSDYEKSEAEKALAFFHDTTYDELLRELAVITLASVCRYNEPEDVLYGSLLANRIMELE